MPEKLSIIWSYEAIADLKSIYQYLQEWNSKETSIKIRNEILETPKTIVFPEQFQADEYLSECRRIIVRNYKIVYSFNEGTITVIGIFNTQRHPSKMRR